MRVPFHTVGKAWQDATPAARRHLITVAVKWTLARNRSGAVLHWGRMVLGAIGDDSWLAKAGPEVVEDAEAELAGAAAASGPEDVAERRLRCVPTLPPQGRSGGRAGGAELGPGKGPGSPRGVSPEVEDPAD